NLRNRMLYHGDTPIELTQVEFQIMEYFMTHSGDLLSRSEILARVWGEDHYGEDKIVDVNIRRLRMKVELDPSEPQHILTAWGKGYQWKP
ncbi:MAG: winged helix-turn-helix domain-containing protein, partial [Clostridia bacterium]|nr:winged helix-turn-helix domain-containing protein [Clostridia bacterium]